MDPSGTKTQVLPPSKNECNCFWKSNNFKFDHIYTKILIFICPNKFSIKIYYMMILILSIPIYKERTVSAVFWLLVRHLSMTCGPSTRYMFFPLSEAAAIPCHAHRILNPLSLSLVEFHPGTSLLFRQIDKICYATCLTQCSKFRQNFSKISQNSVISPQISEIII